MDNLSSNNDKMQPAGKFNFAWLLLMAWRDSRRNRSRLLLFVSSIVLGIAALVAIYSFGNNLRQSIDKQAATLIGADLVLTSNKPITPPIQRLVDSLGGDRSQERSFVSMVLFPKSNNTRLVMVRALEGGFPYYGAIETTPQSAAMGFRQGQQALVDKVLMLQFKAAIGDSVKVGQISFKIAGVLNKAPGSITVSSSVAPLVYIPMRYLGQTGLLQKGSRIVSNYYFKFSPKTNTDQLVKRIDPVLEKEAVNYQTIQTQKEQTGRSFDDLTRFFSLVGFIALLLGCIGVAGAIHIYVREKIGAIAIMRCLGVNGWQAFLIYLLQITGVGFAGSVAGAFLGTFIQRVLPWVLQDFLPFAIDTNTSWAAIGQGVLLGVLISILFALLPLISVRNVSPLNTLRISFEEGRLSRDPLKWLVYLLILAFVSGFAWLQLRDVKQAAIFTLCVLLAFGVLTLTARLLMFLVKRFFPFSWSYLWRQGFLNLYRPNNQSVILMVSIGLGTALICTLVFIEALLIQRVTLSANGSQPNMILFDIQSGQREGVAALTRRQGLPVISQVPIVTMTLEQINGKTAAQLSADSLLKGPSKKDLGHEFRVTYRDTLISTEHVKEGKWIGHVGSNDTVPISIEERYARRMRFKIGDHLLFNVQGLPVNTVITSLRSVNYNRIQTNFWVVFPAGVLEQAPQFYVLMSRVPNSKASAGFQSLMVKNYPNVSVVDLGLIINVVDELLDKVGFVIRFMALFSIVTGLIVLIASVRISKYQRMEESVLLRTLGASRKQILAITSLEYFFLGFLAAATGIILALMASWALAVKFFDTTFHPHLLPVLGILAIISTLTVVIGLLNSWSVLNKPPLEVLRKDV